MKDEINLIKSLLGQKQDDDRFRVWLFPLNAKRMVVDRVCYLDCADYGLHLVFSGNGFLSSVSLYSEGVDYHRRYMGRLPFDVQFGQWRDDIRDRLGLPVATGGGIIGMMGTLIPPWDEYAENEFLVTFHFSSENLKLELVTMTTIEMMNTPLL